MHNLPASIDENVIEVRESSFFPDIGNSGNFTYLNDITGSLIIIFYSSFKFKLQNRYFK